MTKIHFLQSARSSSARPLSVTHRVYTSFYGGLMCVHQGSFRSIRSLLRMMTLLVALLLSLSLHAQSFEELEYQLKKHPQLQSMDYKATENRELSHAQMGLPDPVISLGVNNFPIFDPSFTEFLPTNKAIGVQQKFPSRSSRKARSEMTKAEADQFDEQHKQLFSAMRAELIALLHKKGLIKTQYSLAEQRDKKYDQLIEVVESSVQGGQPSVYRLADIEAERTEVAQALVDLAAEAAQVNARLIYLVGSVPLTMPPVINKAAWSGNAMNFHASQVAAAAVKTSDSGVDLAESAWSPEWGAQLTYQQREDGDNFRGDDWVTMMLTFTVPLWSNKNQAPRLRAAVANQAAAQSVLLDAKRQAMSQYTYSSATYNSANQLKVILQQKINAISDKVIAQKASYESGEGDYAPVIDGEISILKLRGEIAAQEVRSEVALAQMNALVVSQ